jgi:hypothetical protein
LLVSCGAKIDTDGAALGGETHFLVTCGQGCGEGLSCIEGVCTSSCEPGYSSCSELATLAECVSPSDNAAELVPFGGRCDVLCSSDLDCAPLGRGYSCRSGACRAEPEDRQAAFALGTNTAPLVRAVDTDTCRSRLLWVGGDRPSAEMHPGSDCMSCHDDASARPLIVGGTVYPLGDIQTPQPLDDCFGIEGVEVTVADADGRERSTFTNRAGNFYFAGRESELFLPYRASIRWSVDGDEKITPMFTLPTYGGCARCHHERLRGYYPASDGAEAPAETVIPAGSVIFLPGFYPE